MTREELLEECFGRSDFPTPLRIVQMKDENTGDVMSNVDVYLRRVLVKFPRSAAAIGEASTTLMVAGIAQVCTAPEHRGKGFARALVRRAHTEMKEHHPVKFAALFGLLDVYGSSGYFHPDGAEHPHFLVCRLTDEDWPAGRVIPQGTW